MLAVARGGGVGALSAGTKLPRRVRHRESEAPRAQHVMPDTLGITWALEQPLPIFHADLIRLYIE